MSIVERWIFSELEDAVGSEEIIVLTGCRQSGKTTAFRHLFNRLEGSNKLFLDLENVLNRKYFEEENYELIKSAFEFQGLDFTKKAYIFLDEIQYAPNLPSVVKYLKDHYRVKFFLTGSVSFYLKNLFSESLSGRKYIFHIYPLTFSEFLLFKGRRPAGPEEFSAGLDMAAEGLFQEYMQFGGFPGVVLKGAVSEKKRKLEDIFSSYFEMEVEKLRDFTKLQKARDALLLLFLRCGSLLDVSRLASELGISRITLKGYIDFFEKTFFFDFVRPYSSNRDVEIRKRAKVYPVDVGLARKMGFQADGALFECAVYQNLKVRNTVNYYRRKSGQEIDFIVNQDAAIEAKQAYHRRDMESLKRITGGLKKIRDYKMITCKRPPEDATHAEWAPRFLMHGLGK